ncbi:Transcriptional regulator, AraC family [Devosia sp. LC5]|uniref:helix-turn-helix domain-containing protein n=1 Tax=Devosia sp. LC5 TaxID=1502724 RepID=UPI0004E40B30|nr:AraC family transcriptional regulator [Devosia sp. LC5]KFC69497.1 Transcriptional regulator, AraC family [Devosia sp. LC5]
MLHDCDEARRRLGVDQGASAIDILWPIPIEAGPRVTTCRGGAVHSIRPPGSEAFTADAHFIEVMLAPSPNMAAAFGGDQLRHFDAPAGMIVISPANVDSRSSWASIRENAIIAIKPESLLELAAHEADLGKVELRTLPFGTVDQEALRMARLLRAELTERVSANELYVDSLVTLFGIHVLRNYSDAAKLSASARNGGLSPQNARRVQEFLHANFAAPMSVAELAAVCNLSPSHFIHGFTRTFGRPPYQYVLNLRLDFAETLLRKGDMKIEEVAHYSGFSSQSHLTSAMRRYRGKTPAQVRLST